MPTRTKVFDDVLDVLLFPLELPFQLLEEKAPELKRPPLPHEILRNSELRNMLPPRPPLPHEILDQAIKPGSNPGGSPISLPARPWEKEDTLQAARDISDSLEDLSFAWATLEDHAGMFGYLSGQLVKILGVEKTEEVAKEISSVVEEETGGLDVKEFSPSVQPDTSALANQVEKDIGLTQTAFYTFRLPKPVSRGFATVHPEKGKVSIYISEGAQENVHWHEGCHAFLRERDLENLRHKLGRNPTIQEYKESGIPRKKWWPEEAICDIYAAIKMGESPTYYYPWEQKAIEAYPDIEEMYLVAAAG